MGMYDTIRYECPFCKEETDCQTKIGENSLDWWLLGDETTLPDIEFVGKDPCHICNNRATFVIYESKLALIKKEPSPEAKREVSWGSLVDLSVNPDQVIEDIAQAFRETFKAIDDDSLEE